MQRNILAANHALKHGTAGSGNNWLVVAAGPYRHLLLHGNRIFEYFGNGVYRFCLCGYDTHLTKRWLNQLFQLNGIDAKVSSREGTVRLTHNNTITEIDPNKEYTIHERQS